MGYAFLAFSDTSRDFALHVRNQLEVARISVWFREPHLDTDVNQEIIRAALQAASVMVVVWRKATENTSYVIQLQRELTQVRQLDIPVIMVSAEDEVERVIERLKAMPSLEGGLMPLPIPMLEEALDAPPVRSPDVDAPRNRSSWGMVIIIVVSDIVVLLLIGLLVLLQSPGGSLNPFTATPSATLTPSLTLTTASPLISTTTAGETPGLTMTLSPARTPEPAQNGTQTR